MVVIEDEELAYATERYLFDRGCQVLVLRDAGPENSDLLAELAAAGLVLILDWTPDQKASPGVPIWKPSRRESTHQIWAALVADGVPDPTMSSCGEGI